MSLVASPFDFAQDKLLGMTAKQQPKAHGEHVPWCKCRFLGFARNDRQTKQKPTAQKDMPWLPVPLLVQADAPKPPWWALRQAQDKRWLRNRSIHATP